VGATEGIRKGQELGPFHRRLVIRFHEPSVALLSFPRLDVEVAWRLERASEVVILGNRWQTQGSEDSACHKFS
jgi:hypothetical protein